MHLDEKEERMPERVHEKRSTKRKKVGVDWWAVICAIVALLVVKLGIVQKIPW